jgi:hypothetical protein
MSVQFDTLVGKHFIPTTDLGLETTLAANASATSDGVTTASPATVVVISKLTSGDATLKIDIAATAAAIDFSSPTASLSLSGTDYQSTVVNTTSSALFVAFQQIAGSGGVVFDDLAFLVLYEISDGMDWLSGLRSSSNCIAASTIGDGSGVIDLTP